MQVTNTTILRVSGLVVGTGISLACGGEPMGPGEADLGKTQNPVVYGDDHRTEYRSIDTQRVRSWADATAQLFAVSRDDWCPAGQRTCEIDTEVRDLCDDEAYASQADAADGWCTAFLVGPDLFATAGHCINSGSCASRSLAFGWRVTSGTQGDTDIPRSDTYQCTNVLESVNVGDVDWAVFKVDRVVTGRVPLFIQRMGEVSGGEALTMIGHPYSLPVKVDQGAQVQGTAATHFFTANLDAFGGNSGSPVIRTETGVVEGILVRGNPDFVRDPAGCIRINQCPDTGCDGTFESASYVAELQDHVPLHPAGIVAAMM